VLAHWTHRRTNSERGAAGTPKGRPRLPQAAVLRRENNDGGAEAEAPAAWDRTVITAGICLPVSGCDWEMESQGGLGHSAGQVSRPVPFLAGQRSFPGVTHFSCRSPRE